MLKKLRLDCKKPHGSVVYSVTHRMRPSQKKSDKKSGKLSKLELSPEGCDACYDTHSGTRLFGQNKPFFSTFLIYVYVCFVGNVAFICMISICVADISYI